MLIHRIKLTNLLSFGPNSDEIELGPLNVLIGPNGSGKSNFIDAIGLLNSAPSDLDAAIRAGGGIGDWLWRAGAESSAEAKLELVLEGREGMPPVRYGLSLAEQGQFFRVSDERLADAECGPKDEDPWVYFAREQNKVNVRERVGKSVTRSGFSCSGPESAFSVLKDPGNYPQITHVGRAFEGMRLYRDWSFGRTARVRLPQKPDMANNYLSEDAANIGLVLNRLSLDVQVKRKILDGLKDLYEGVTDFHVSIEYGTVQVFLSEGQINFPATRLSDGAIRYLSMLAILCDPSPPPLVCLEEPELGLHPDILPGLADLLREASERCQLIVTTHSDVLVDKLTDTPESIVICEKHQGQTQLRRLQKDDLAHWLKDYSLGDLWTKGELGGNRW